jgi:hypothetical protein
LLEVQLLGQEASEVLNLKIVAKSMTIGGSNGSHFLWQCMLSPCFLTPLPKSTFQTS